MHLKIINYCFGFVLLFGVLLSTERGFVELPAEINRTPKDQISNDEQVFYKNIAKFTNSFSGPLPTFLQGKRHLKKDNARMMEGYIGFSTEKIDS